MRPRFLSRLLYLVVLPAVVSGCDRPEQAPVAKADEKPVEIGELPSLGDSIGPLDDGRIRAAPPENWAIPSRKTGFVVRFVESERLTYPRIHVTATDYENTIGVAGRKYTVEQKAPCGLTAPICTRWPAGSSFSNHKNHKATRADRQRG